MVSLPYTLVQAAATMAALLGSIWWFQRSRSPRIRALCIGCALAAIALLPSLFTAICGYDALGNLVGDATPHGNRTTASLYEKSNSSRILEVATMLHNLGWFVAGLSIFRYARSVTPSQARQ